MNCILMLLTIVAIKLSMGNIPEMTEVECMETCNIIQEAVCCGDVSYYNKCYAECDGISDIYDECRRGSCLDGSVGDEYCFKQIHKECDLVLSLDGLYYDRQSNITTDPEILHIENLVYPIKPYIFCLNEIFYRYLPIHSELYKALEIPDGGLWSQQSVLNTYASRAGWFGTLSVAERYANSEWGMQNNWKVMQFETITDLKLFQLGIYSNIEYLYEAILSDISWYKSKKDDIREEIDDLESREFALSYNQQLIDQKLLWLDVLKLTLGIKASYNDQIELVLKYGNTMTDDYSYHPQDEISKRLNGEIPNKYYWFFSESSDDQNYILSLKYSTKWGSDKSSLNRISFTTDIDRILCDIISTYTNTDGYIAPDMPSLFHLNGRLNSEIALFKARDSIENKEVLNIAIK